MFRRSIWYKFLVVIISISMFLSGCGGSGKDVGESGVANKEKSNWEYEKKINEPIKAVSGEEDLVLGNLDENNVEVFIPAGAFLEPTEVTLINPDTIANYKEDEMIGLGAPIAIVAGEESVRLEQPVKITMRYDPAELEENYESGELYIGYFNGSEWQYMKTEVDRDNKTMWFYTSHFSPYGGAKLKLDQRIDEYISNEAVAEWAKDQTSTITDEALTSAIDHILKEKLKINDDSITGRVLSSLQGDSEWADMVANIKDGDPEKFNQNLQLLLGKKIVENVGESTLKNALSTITDELGVEMIEKASEAAGYLAEGRAKDAARIIGEHIADKFMITKVGKFAVAAIDSQIKSWKSEEIEAAYLAYKNGASSSIPWWGYQVEKGNFNDVWTQMGGAARQLELEAIREQNKAREEAFMEPLTKAEEDKIRGSVQKDLKKQFESRLQKDQEIEVKRQEIKMIMDMFKDANLLEKGRFGWTDAYELETRLDVLNHFKNKLLKDTGRVFIKPGDVHNAEAISVNQLKTIAMGWFSTEDPVEQKKMYEEFLKAEFGINLYPSAAEINGKWSSSSMIITEFDLGPPPSESSAGTGEGCDLSDLNIYNMIKAGLEDMKGKSTPMQISLNIGDGGTGTMDIIDDDGTTVANATYNSGSITATTAQDGATITYSGEIRKSDDNSITLSGSFTMTLGEGAFIKGSWSGVK